MIKLIFSLFFLFVIKVNINAQVKATNNNINCVDKCNLKLSPSLFAIHTQLKNSPNNNTIFILTANNIAALNHVLELHKHQIFVRKQINNSAIISCTNNYFLKNIFTNDSIIFVDLFVQPTTEIELIGYNRSLNEIQLISKLLPTANAKGITIGIKETNINEQDIDVLGRVKPSALADKEKDPHATVVATLAGGAGNSFITGRGLAWGCNFYPSTFSNLFPDNAITLLQNNVTVQNHSYGTIKQNFYGAEAAAYDAQIFNDAKNLVHVFSSGNKGQEAAIDGVYRGINGFSNLTGNFKMAKNIIAVGATDTANNVVPFSSTGPLYDGRLAPQITALGPNGTSDAAAIVSGAAAILQQIFKDSNNQQLPTAALIKAALFTTATDIGVNGIDYKSGFGSLNTYKAALVLQNKQYFEGAVANNEIFKQTISLPANASNFKVTVVWADTTAKPNASKALVNDIDIEVKEIITNTIFLPWVLSSVANADSLQLLPTRKKDTLNNAEQITIDNIQGNNYEIALKGSSIKTLAKQPFSVAYTYNTLNTFTFTNPLDASDINLDESPTVKIKWDVATASPTEKGNLLVSYNDGVSWVNLASQLLLNSKVFHWLLPDTATKALLKMDCSFGSFLSPSFIIAPTTKVSVGFLCADSLQLNWNKHVHANSYQLFSLTDSAYLKLTTTTTDTFIVLKNSGTQKNIYAIKPILNNGLLATSSVAINAANQGVNCFYKTFLAVDDITKITLQLTVTLPQNIDSIVFEKVGFNGNLIKKISSTKILVLNQEYSATDIAPNVGSNYYRASIYLKNGSIIFTEKVTVISNANQPIFIYPNPVKQGQPFTFQLNNFNAGNTLQLINSKGQIVKRIVIGQAGKITTSNLLAGLYFYMVTKPDGTTFANGKIMISQ